LGIFRSVGVSVLGGSSSRPDRWLIVDSSVQTPIAVDGYLLGKRLRERLRKRLAMRLRLATLVLWHLSRRDTLHGSLKLVVVHVAMLLRRVAHCINLGHTVHVSHADSVHATHISYVATHVLISSHGPVVHIVHSAPFLQ